VIVLQTAAQLEVSCRVDCDAGQGERINAIVLVEASVLGGDDRLRLNGISSSAR
jgi:hypothetical protein